jgi:uncharacterized protein
MSCKHCESLINGEPDVLQEGFSAYEGGDYAKALQFLLPYAESEVVVAQCMIGSMYQLGLGTPMNGLEAVKWYLRAGEQGCGLSYNNLATIYSGTLSDVTPDPEKAKECWQKATDNGFTMVPVRSE